MITLKSNSGDIEKFLHEINLKVEGMQAMINPDVLTEINNAIFTVSSRRFVRALNLAAKVEPKKFHHIYEWGQVGKNVKRLYRLTKDLSSGSYLRIGASFTQSKTPVPIPAKLLEMGRTGKAVSARNIFKDKAEVMESGIGISYQARRTLAFLNSAGNIAFIPAGQIVNILNPGGTQVKGAFEKFFREWYAINTVKVVQSSGIMSSLQDAIVNALNQPNAGAEKARESAISTLRSYSQNKVVE
jgi:hypothetical protein